MVVPKRWLPDELGLESEHWRPPWGQTILKKDGVDKSSSWSKYNSSGDATRDEPENQRLRRQLEQNSQQREEFHSNGEGEGDTGRDEFRVQTTTNQTCARPRTARRHPFVDGIMEVELSARWKWLTMSQYDGTTDPEEHVDVFSTQVGLYTSNDTILCRVMMNMMWGRSHWEGWSTIHQEALQKAEPLCPRGKSTSEQFKMSMSYLHVPSGTCHPSYSVMMIFKPLTPSPMTQRWS